MFALTKSQHGYGCNYQILCKSIIPLLIALLLIMVPSKICVGTGCLSEYAIDTCLMISLYDFRCLFIHFLSTHVWPGSTGADGLTLLGIECDRMYRHRIKRVVPANRVVPAARVNRGRRPDNGAIILSSGTSSSSSSSSS